MQWVRYTGAAAVFTVAALVVGCSGDGDFGDVSGTVSYDGQPVEDGSITFFPIDGKGQTAGDAIKGGKYSVKKVPARTMKVTFSGSKVVGKRKAYDTPDSPEIPIIKEYIPAKFNEKSEQTFDVKRGHNEKNWDLVK